MPIPRTEAGKRKLIRSAMLSKRKSFKRGSSQARAREALAQKLIAQGKDREAAYAIATAAIKRGMKRK